MMKMEKLPIINKKEEMPDKSTVFDKMFDFRNIILNKDYFGEIFETFKNTLAFINSDVNLESIDSPDKFPKLINVSFNFNKMTIKEDIEKVLAKYV